MYVAFIFIYIVKYEMFITGLSIQEYKSIEQELRCF